MISGRGALFGAACVLSALVVAPSCSTAQEGQVGVVREADNTYVTEGEDKIPAVSIALENDTYHVGDVMVVKMEFLNMTPDPGGLWMLVVLPEVAHEDGTPVEKFPLAKFRSKLDSVDLEKVKDFRAANDGRIRYVFWKIQDKQWENTRTGEVVYDGVGFEGGVTPLGTFVYCLDKVPGKYRVLLTRMLQRRWDPTKYDPGVEPSNFMKSNMVEVEILPAEGHGEDGVVDDAEY